MVAKSRAPSPEQEPKLKWSDQFVFAVAVSRDPETKPFDVCVALELAQHCHPWSLHCDPSKERLAEILGKSEKHVAASISRLALRDWIDVRSRRGARGANAYALNVPKAWTAFRAYGTESASGQEENPHLAGNSSSHEKEGKQTEKDRLPGNEGSGAQSSLDARQRERRAIEHAMTGLFSKKSDGYRAIRACRDADAIIDRVIVGKIGLKEARDAVIASLRAADPDRSAA